MRERRELQPSKPPAQLPECGWSSEDQATIKPINFIASKYQAHNININSGNGWETQTVDGTIPNGFFDGIN